MITKYMEYCCICGRPAEWHHIFKGVKQRKLSDLSGMILPLCPEHHRGIMGVHNHKELNVLCEIIGQLAWERDRVIEKTELPFDDLSDEVREEFRAMFGRSYL